MLDIIIWFIPRIVTFYFLLATFVSGAICYFLLQPSLKKEYPTESKIARYGGLIYMIGGPISYFIVNIIF